MVLLWGKSIIYSLCYRHKSVAYKQGKCQEGTQWNQKMTHSRKQTTYDIKYMNACYQNRENRCVPTLCGTVL